MNVRYMQVQLRGVILVPHVVTQTVDSRKSASDKQPQISNEEIASDQLYS